MINRIKELRKNLGLNQAEFGKAIGVSRDTIANIEGNRMEIKELHIKAICKQYNVSYAWLTTGEGEMYSSIDDEVQTLIDNLMTSDNEVAKALIRTLAHQDEAFWDMVVKVGRELLEEVDKKKTNA